MPKSSKRLYCLVRMYGRTDELNLIVESFAFKKLKREREREGWNIITLQTNIPAYEHG